MKVQVNVFTQSGIHTYTHAIPEDLTREIAEQEVAEFQELVNDTYANNTATSISFEDDEYGDVFINVLNTVAINIRLIED